MDSAKRVFVVPSRAECQGCIVGPDLAVMSLVLVKKGAEEIPGGPGDWVIG